jgi:hypothetical protein
VVRIFMGEGGCASVWGGSAITIREGASGSNNTDFPPSHEVIHLHVAIGVTSHAPKSSKIRIPRPKRCSGWI